MLIPLHQVLVVAARHDPAALVDVRAHDEGTALTAISQPAGPVLSSLLRFGADEPAPSSEASIALLHLSRRLRGRTFTVQQHADLEPANRR